MNSTLLVKLALSPALVALASLVARRWGPQVGGWLIGFPLTSAPVAFALVLQYGPRFAASAAAGTLLGVLSQAAFALIYARVAARTRGPVPLLVATLVFAASTFVFARVLVPPAAAALLVAAGTTVALVAMPRNHFQAARTEAASWDLPARMVVAAVFVLAVTGAASLIGPRLTGLVSPFPLYATILAVFAQVQQGPAAAAAVMRGLLTGLYGFGAFFLALALLLQTGSPTAIAFGAATTVVVVVQFLVLAVTRTNHQLGTH